MPGAKKKDPLTPLAGCGAMARTACESGRFEANVPVPAHDSGTMG